VPTSTGNVFIAPSYNVKDWARPSIFDGASLSVGILEQSGTSDVQAMITATGIYTQRTEGTYARFEHWAYVFIPFIGIALVCIAFAKMFKWLVRT